VSLLRFLGEAPALRSRVATSAANVVEWPEATRALIDRLDALVNAERASPRGKTAVAATEAKAVLAAMQP
jgi:hypothetical protein